MKGFASYLLSFFATVIVGSTGLLAVAGYYETVYPDDYLASLRENSTFGCSNAGTLQSEVFFMGDSHSYAAWDFNLASKLMGTPHISGCMMGAFYLETLPAVMRTFEENRSHPKKLIYGTSLWQFTDSREGKQAQLAQHENLLKSFRSPFNLAVAFDKIRNNINWQEMNGNSPSNVLQRKLSYHSNKVESSSEDSATALMNEVSTESKLLWQENQKSVTFTPDAEKKIADFCNWVNRNEIELYVIDLPESPYMVASYRKSDIEKYQKILELFKQCSGNVVFGDARTYGLGNRHYINRSMLDGFPYEKIGKDKELTSVPVWQLYDLDHMDLVGANKFTPIALERLGLMRNYKTID